MLHPSLRFHREFVLRWSVGFQKELILSDIGADNIGKALDFFRPGRLAIKVFLICIGSC